MDTNVQRLSESVFGGLCRIIGTSQQVAMRRDMMDIMDLLLKKSIKSEYSTTVLTGSQREGFKLFEGSPKADRDSMTWPNDHRVFWNIAQLQNCKKGHIPLFADRSDSSPGYTLLQLITRPIFRDHEQSTCVRIKDKFYLSSSVYRKINMIFPGSFEHGPCSRGVIVGKVHYDFASCFASDFWPPSASSWIKRCHSWPHPRVVDEIVKNGCHFAAIGHKLGNHENNEWRISFRFAELKLVYTMNHCQFLMYGLLKIFLKEVIIPRLGEEVELLSSYHMKTAVFWVLQQNITPHWCPQNLLDCFWICFKLIIKWVYEGTCPNFFIPKNNMFLTKIYGNSQRTLFQKLYTLYEIGLKSLLHSPSIGPYLTAVLENPRLRVSTDERSLVTEFDVFLERLLEIYQNDAYPFKRFSSCMHLLKIVEQIINLPLTQNHVAMLQKRTAFILKSTAFMLNMYTSSKVKKIRHIADKVSLRLLKLAVKFGFDSDLLYIAMYYYKTSRHEKAISVLKMIMRKFEHEYFIYNGNVRIHPKRLPKQMRPVVTQDIKLLRNICYLNELRLEQIVQHDLHSLLFIPPVVMFHLLEFLCYKQTNLVEARSALFQLQLQIHFCPDNVGEPMREIFWQILGNCQQMSGYPLDALYSYQRSLQQLRANRIQTATIIRIIIAIYKIIGIYHM
ncbi:uncharacterized protein LOC134245465 [Saccostrea cucullata]|uniref:uncharacterized protein LOC134245465 n=1 Tax=Saccostrea cuccullata TaxID=36930 RepID=UPI002ED0532E